MLSFESSLFAMVGVLAAAGPIIIHLLNRRRFRPVQWAAMDFLKQAIERNRRVLHFRDLLLLALRVLAVLLFGAALARPFYRGSAFGAIWHGAWLAIGILGLFGAAIWAVIAADTARKKQTAAIIAGVAGLISLWNASGLWRSSTPETATAGSQRQPLHAVLLLDNSRSLGVEDVGTLLLEQAKTKAREFLMNLPQDSRLTVIPLAGSEEAYPLDAYRHREEMEKAVDRIPLVDTSGSLRRGLELAAQACRQVAELPTKRVVLISDLQRSEFRDTDWGELIEPLGGLQIAPVSPKTPSNVWISSFELEDGLAGVESPCRFLARLESSGGTPIASILLRLSIDGTEVASQTVELSPGQSREVEFVHQLDGGADPERVSFSLAGLELQTDQPADDQLTADNRRSLVIPVLAAVPIVFVDEYGPDEDLARNRIGETYALRHLLAPKTAGDLEQRQLFRVQHVRADQITEDLLSSARLVVLAGLERPDFNVPLLREFVQQGGPVVVLAGGRFDPAAWQSQAWLDGRGILPAPLKAEYYGVTPDEAPDRLKPFFADFSSMQHDFFLIEQEDPEQLAAIFESTPFFKSVQADVSEAALAALRDADTQRLAAEQTFLTEYAARRQREISRTNSPAETQQQEADDRRFRELEPGWWLWRSTLPLVDRSLTPAVLAERQQPHALALFKGLEIPFVVDRRIGAGRVVMVTTGITSDWNLLRASPAMYAFHRMISGLIEDTLPVRNFDAGSRISLPVQRQSDVKYVLTRPSGRAETLVLEALTADVSGIQIRSPLSSGPYRIAAEQTSPQSSDESAAKSKVDEWLFAVNGSPNESDLTRISPEELTKSVRRDDVRVLGVNENIDLQGGTRRGQGLWHAALIGMLAALLGEMLLLSWPALTRKEAA